jgi:hypothetical protein
MEKARSIMHCSQAAGNGLRGLAQVEAAGRRAYGSPLEVQRPMTQRPMTQSQMTQSQMTGGEGSAAGDSEQMEGTSL